MAPRRFSNVIGFDDAPFARNHRGLVPVVGAVFAGRRFDGVLIGRVEKDGTDAAEKLAGMIEKSKFMEHIRLIMLQGITLAGFNVIDVFALYERLRLPILVVARRAPDREAIRKALTVHIPAGEAKWGVIERLGPMEAVGKVHVQRVGLSQAQAAAVVARFAVHSRIPEPLRAAHMIATALVAGESRGNP